MISGEPVTVLVPSITYDEAKNEVVVWGPITEVPAEAPASQTTEPEVTTEVNEEPNQVDGPIGETADGPIGETSGTSTTLQIGIPVENVLFGRPSTERIEEVARYHGAVVSYVLGFPKGFSGDLRGCMVRRERDASMWRVIGDPRPLPPETCPTPWNMEVDVEAVNG